MTPSRTLFFAPFLFAGVAIWAIIALLPGADDAEAAFPGANGKIAFGQFAEDTIRTVNPDGTALATLASGANPAWSPDGSKIAYDRDIPGVGREIFVMYADGSNQLRITYNLFSDEWPTWSPDGSKLALVSNRDGNRELYVMDADGSAQTRLTTTIDDEFAPDWSPDGLQIMFTRSGTAGVAGLYTIPAAGGPATLLAVDGAGGDWSPDGTQIAFYDSHLSCSSFGCFGSIELEVMNFDGTGRTVINNGSPSGRPNELDPSWSPDGSRIAVGTFPDGGLRTLDPDGTNDSQVVDPGGWEIGVDWQPLCDSCPAEPLPTLTPTDTLTSTPTTPATPTATPPPAVGGAAIDPARKGIGGDLWAIVALGSAAVAIAAFVVSLSLRHSEGR